MYYTDEYFISVFAFVVLVVAVRLPSMFSSLALHAFFLDLSVSLCLSLTLSVCFYLSHSHSHSLSLSRCSVYLGLLYIITVVRLASCVHHGNHLSTDNWLQPPPPRSGYPVTNNTVISPPCPSDTGNTSLDWRLMGTSLCWCGPRWRVLWESDS